MALPRVNMGGINQAWGQASQAQQGAYDRLASLGQQINNSLLEQNLAKEAQEMAPVIGQEYQSAFQAIEQGDISGGLSRIYQTNAQVSRNPILARQSQEITKAAEMMSQDYMRTRLETMGQDRTDARQQAGFENQRDMTEYTQGKTDERQQKAFDQQEKIVQLTKKDPKDLTWSEKGFMSRMVFNKAGEAIKFLKENPDDTAGQEQQIRFLGTLIGNAKRFDPSLSDAENLKLMTNADRKDLDELETKLLEYQEKAKTGGRDGWFGGGKEYVQLVKETEDQIKEIHAKAQKFYMDKGIDLDKEEDAPTKPEDPMAEEVAAPANPNAPDIYTEPALPTQAPAYKSAADVGQAFKEGKINQADAIRLLKPFKSN